MRKRLQLGSRAISYLENAGGAGEPGRPPRTLLWLHGFALNADTWAPQLAAVPPGWRAIAPDLPGAGGTDPLGRDRTPSIDEFAADAIDLLQALHIDHAVIGGLSMGGYIAFALYRLLPNVFSGVILADTRATADTPEGLEGRRRTIALAERGGAAAVADDLTPKLLGETTRRDRPEIAAGVRAMMASNPVGTITAASMAMMARPDSTATLREMHIPALVIVGREDAITPLAESEKIHQGIAGSSLAVLEQAGHLSNVEQPSAFNAAVAAFLSHRV